MSAPCIYESLGDIPLRIHWFVTIFSSTASLRGQIGYSRYRKGGTKCGFQSDNGSPLSSHCVGPIELMRNVALSLQWEDTTWTTEQLHQMNPFPYLKSSPSKLCEAFDVFHVLFSQEISLQMESSSAFDRRGNKTTKTHTTMSKLKNSRSEFGTG